MLRVPYILRLPSRLRRRARRSRMAAMILLCTVICIVIAPFYIIYKPPALLVRYFQHRWPDVLWHVPTTSKIVALTIDDGPSEYTEEIMGILKENNSTATFFIIGSQVAGREDKLLRLVRNGNELGNHAMHDEPAVSLDDSTLVGQIRAVEKMNHEAYKAANAELPPKYFRPGSGLFNERMRASLKKLQYRLVLGSIYPYDAQLSHPRLNANHILSLVRPGSIIICHDRRSWTVPMLRRVLPQLRRRGYQVATLTNLLREVG